MKVKKSKICIIGLGYVGLPLATAFAENYRVVGFDINEERIKELKNAYDHTCEIENYKLKQILLDKYDSGVTGLYVSNQQEDILNCNVYIITVPTPTDKHNRPLLTPMIRATEMVASVLKVNDIVIYESTVYPGITENEMVPILENLSGLRYNLDFFCGYSPERINPGDKNHTVTKIIKVTSGSTPATADFVDDLYKSIIIAGTHKAPSIMVAEAAKVIENSQRDINIAFVNELSKMFSLMGIDTQEVLDAASTKWNFLNFKPGLVGGHCIGVDPYYLAHKAQEVGYHPEIILAGRRLNDSMGKYVANQVLKLMMRKNLNFLDSKILILGFTFKEDCPDVRNTRVIDIYDELRNFDLEVLVYDPLADPTEVKAEYNIDICNELPDGQFSAAILAVAHKQFSNLNLRSLANNGVVYDVKGVLPKGQFDDRL
jgi:UDP-N-acetyl-D-galactosamine dehydrogenase